MTADTIAWLHIRSQSTYHDEAEIIGTRAGLVAVAIAVEAALASRESVAAVFANDGEGYRLKVRCSNRVRDLGEPFYVDEIARELANRERDFIVSNYKMIRKQDAEALKALRWCRANGDPHLAGEPA